MPLPLSSVQHLPTSLLGKPLSDPRSLTGSVSSQCWRMQWDQKAVVWRPSLDIHPLIAVNRQTEAKFLAALSQTEIAPQLLDTCEAGIFVEFVEGEHFAGDVAQICQLLAKVHQYTVDSPVFDMKARLRHYWQHLEQKTPQSQALYQGFMQAEPPRVIQLGVVHLDAGRHNLIQTPTRLCLIDWEYAAMGCVALDLAMLCRNESVDAQQVAHHYAPFITVSEEKLGQAIEAWLPWCDMLAALWYRLCARYWQSPACIESAEQIESRLR
uniref:phosphotransferase n=1 Tax=Thaumasiovibrio occultus TaxID=1891184 RepID=UPI000B35136F|nr:phosphotransferase [Thaumasiovibrio occultus]